MVGGGGGRGEGDHKPQQNHPVPHLLAAPGPGGGDKTVQEVVVQCQVPTAESPLW